MKNTLFKKLGGFSSIRKIVSHFYDGVLASSILQAYFVNTDMQKLIDHQTQFISSLLGGPASTTDSQLEKVHAQLNIREEAWREIVDILEEALEDFDVNEQDIAVILNEIEKKKRLIVQPEVSAS